MKFNSLLLLSILFLSSCASFKKKYTCYPHERTIQGTKVQFCSLNGSNPTLYGVVKYGTEEWIAEPEFTYHVSNVGNKLYLKHKDGRLLLYNFQAKKLEPSPYKDIFFFGHTADSRKYVRQMIHYENGDIAQMNYSTGEAFPNRIKNVDSTIFSSTGHRIYPYYEGIISGVIVRHNVDGRKFYKIYDYLSNPISDEFPFEDVTLALTDTYNSKYIFVHRVDKEKDLYWPMIFDRNRYYKRPQDVHGLLLHLVEHWKSKTTYNPYDMKVPKLTGSFRVAFQGQNDKPDHLVYGDHFNFDKLKSIDEFSKVIDKARQKKENRVYDYSWLMAKTAISDGSIQEVKFTILKNEDNKYGFGTGAYVDDKSYVFDSKEDAIKGIRMLEGKASEFASINKKNHEANVLKDQAMRNEFIAADKAEAQKIRDEHAESAARNKALDDAEKAAIWGRVSDQIQGAADRAKVKGDCVKKNTQTKKDFLAKKQGWYTTGGCD